MTTTPAPRKYLAAELKPLLPAGWKIAPWNVNLDALSTTVVILKQTGIEKAQAAPAGANNVKFVATIASPSQDLQRAEDDLDDNVNALLHSLESIRGVSWTDATKVMFDNYLAYDVNLTLTTQKEF